MNYVVTVYRTTGNQVQRYNFSDIETALVNAKAHVRARYVHKVEVSLILATMQDMTK